MPPRGFEKISKAEILDALRQFAHGRNENFTMLQFCQHLGIGCGTLLERWGRWADLRQAAGLKRRRCAPKYEFSDQELIDEYRRVVQALGRAPRAAEFNRLAKCRMITLYKRFGSLEHIRRRFRCAEQALELWGRSSPLPDKPRLPWDVDWLCREWQQVRIGFALYASDIRTDLAHRGYAAAVNWSVPLQPSDPDAHSVRGAPLPDSTAQNPGFSTETKVLAAVLPAVSPSNPLTPPPFPFDLLVVIEHDWPGCPVPILRLSDLTRFRQRRTESDST